MKIGIDIGGSHIGVGLTKDEKILIKRERDFLDSEKRNIKTVIVEIITDYIREILEEANLKLNEIEQIRNCSSTEHAKAV